MHHAERVWTSPRIVYALWNGGHLHTSTLCICCNCRPAEVSKHEGLLGMLHCALALYFLHKL